MKLIVGLGNPGPQYDRTRHNLGFAAVEYAREKLGFPTFREETRWKALVSDGLIGNDKVVLVQPLTFMNRSGESVRALLDFYKLALSDLLVIHDELDLPFASLRLSQNASAAGHNGVSDIIEKLGTQDFTRLRLGVAPQGGRETRGDGAEFVLSRFTPEEESAVPDILSAAFASIGQWLQIPPESSGK